MSRPPPPCSSGSAKPYSPIALACSRRRSGTSSRSSISASAGSTSLRTKRRTSRRISLKSSSFTSGRFAHERDAVARGHPRDHVHRLQPGAADELCHQLGRVDGERLRALVAVELLRHLADEPLPAQGRERVRVLDDRLAARLEHPGGL